MPDRKAHSFHLFQLIQPSLKRIALYPGGFWLSILLFIVCTLVFADTLEDIVTHDLLVQVDQTVYHQLIRFRTAWLDTIMAAITELGGPVSMALVAIFVATVLVRQRHWGTLVFWAVDIGFSVLAPAMIKLALERPRPHYAYAGLQAYSFPSGHATASAAVFGFLAYLVGREYKAFGRFILSGATFLVILIVGISRIYIGVHWLSDVIAGASLGTAGAAFLAGIYSLCRMPQLPADQLLWSALLGLLLALIWHFSFAQESAMAFAGSPVIFSLAFYQP